MKRNMTNRVIGLVLATMMIISVFAATAQATAPGKTSNDYLAPNAHRGGVGFPLFFDGRVPDIYISNGEHKQIVRAAGDLKNDILAVTGQTPGVSQTAINPSADIAIIVGSIENSGMIQQIIRDGKLDEAQGIAGLWEAFVVKTVDAPLPGVDKALVIAGSDKRGTIYGIYSVSELIGVSPWYWWGDVTPRMQSEIILDDGVLAQEGEPTVKYRGIFINDERNFREWTSRFVDGGVNKGQPNPAAYEKVCELLLRVKANTLWPAMHFYSTPFNGDLDTDGIPLNAKVADNYGIVMGASHCEMLLRNNETEWSSWASANRGKYPTTNSNGNYTYDYTRNPAAVLAYWRERVETNKDFENIWNVGMRGIHDEPQGMAFGGMPNATLRQKIAVFEEVITEQRKILEEVLGKPADQIPQAFIPYNEAADFYNGDATTPGARIPDDVILMWAEDNQGNVRQVPTEAERQRSGGSGNYFHFSYLGPSKSYLWVNSLPLIHTYEEMRKLYDTGATKYWIVNVGDIKPAELSIEYYMKLGRNIDNFSDTCFNDYLSRIVKRDYDLSDADANETADIILKYFKYAIAKRPEFVRDNDGDQFCYYPNSYGDEAQIQINRFEDLFRRAEAIYGKIAPDRKDAFYQMVFFQIRAALYSVQKEAYGRKSRMYNTQGRIASVNAYAELSDLAYDNIVSDVYDYNQLQNGKWNKIMNPWPESIDNITRRMTLVKKTTADYEIGIGAVCEGQSNGSENIPLRFSSLMDDMRFIDIFNKDASPSEWTVEAGAPYITLSKWGGTVDIEERIWASVDWSKASDGINNTTVTVKDNKGFTKTFSVIADKFVDPGNLPEKVYIEANGYVAIEAEHYSESVATSEGEWRVVHDWGRLGDAMRVYPDTTRRLDFVAGNAASVANFVSISPKLKYNIYFQTAGTFSGEFFRMPTLNEGWEFGVERTGRTAIGLEGVEPSLLRGANAKSSVGWNTMTQKFCDILTFSIRVPSPGLYTLVVYKSDPTMAFDRITINTGGMQASYYGPPESYNTIAFEKAATSRPPELAPPFMPEGALSRYWFNFGNTGGASVELYTTVNKSKIYNGSNIYGWSGDSVINEQFRNINTDTYKVNERDKTFVYGSSPVKFTTKLPSTGRYSVRVIIGDRLSTGGGMSVSNMSVAANGVTMLSGINVAAGRADELGFVVDLRRSPELELEFDGDLWCVTAIVIMPNERVQQNGNDGRFMMEGGAVYIEAETALENSVYASLRAGNPTRWYETAGASGTAMFHGSNTLTNFSTTTPAGLADSPMMSYQVKFDRNGTFYLWAYQSAASLDDDSFHYGLNGVYVNTENPAGGQGRDAQFRWIRVPGTISVTNFANTQTINIWGREDGIILDKFYITNSTSTTPPAGLGGIMRREFTLPVPDSVVISPDVSEIMIGEDIILSASVLPSQADQSIVWKIEEGGEYAGITVKTDGTATLRGIAGGSVIVSATSASDPFVYIERVFKVRDTYVTLSRREDTFIADYKVSNKSGALVEVVCILAKYDESGYLRSVITENISVGAGSAASAVLSASCDAGDSLAKAFIWDAGTYVPICEAAELSVVQYHYNLALNAMVRSPDQEAANPAGNAVNGNRTDRWAAANGNFNKWIEVDLGQVSVLDTIDIAWFFSGTRAYYYRIWGRTEPISDWTANISGDSGKDFAAAGYTLLVDNSANSKPMHTTDNLFGAQARYIVIQVLGRNTTSGSASIYSIEIAGTSRKPLPEPKRYNNLAQGSNIRASTVQNNSDGYYPPENAIDGARTGTRWAANGAAFPQWIEVDLGTECSLETLNIQWYESGTRYYRYTVWGRTQPIDDWTVIADPGKQFSRDSSYSLIINKSDNTKSALTTDVITGSSARYIVICVESSSSSPTGNASMYEIEVSGVK